MADSLLHGADYNHEQWLDRPEILDQDFAAMRETRCNVMSVGIFSWTRYQPQEGPFDFDWMDRLLDRLHQNGLKALLATPSGAKPAWLSRAYPEVCMVDVNGLRDHHHGRHNHCRTSPVYRERVADLNTLLAERYGQHPALFMWHVSNEYNAGRCYCPLCLAAFRDWLKVRYGSLEALNRAWWTSFWSHHFSDWEEIYPADSSMNGMMLDWARFTSDQTMDFFDAEIEPLRRITPQVPITTNFMQPDVGLDYHKFAKRLDMVSWDNYPRWGFEADDLAVAARTAFIHDLYRSVGRKPFLLMESTPSNTNWQGVSPLKRPGMHRLASIQAVAHGADSVQYFQWRQSRGGEEKFHGAVLTHFGGTDSRTFGDVKELGEQLSRLPVAGLPTQTASVAIIYDFPNGWAIDAAQLPRSIDKLYLETVQTHYAAFWKQGVPVDIISASETRLDQYRLIVMPMLYLLDAAEAGRFDAFVQAGGTLVASYLSGLADHSDLCHEGGAPGPLAPTLGLRVEESDAIPDGRPQSLRWRRRNGSEKLFAVRHYADRLRLEGAAVKGFYGEDFLAGGPALTVNLRGKGRAWYIACRTGGDFLDAFYGELCAELGSTRATSAILPAGVSASRRGTGPKSVLFLLNFNVKPVSVDLEPGIWNDLAPKPEPAGSACVRRGRITLEARGLAILTAAD